MTKLRVLSGSAGLKKSRADLLVLLISPKQLGSGGKTNQLSVLEKEFGLSLRQRLKSEQFEAKSGQTKLYRIGVAGKRSDLLIIGGEDSWKERFQEIEAARKIGAAVRKSANEVQARSVALFGKDEWLLRSEHFVAFMEGLHLADYSFTQFKSKPEKGSASRLAEVHFLSKKRIDQRLVDRAAVFAEATSLARNLVNTPPSDCPPSRLVLEARKLAKNSPLQCQVLTVPQLKKLNAGGILGVSRGSSQPPALIRLTYKPKRKAQKVIAIVGKGVTFDSGGLSIKPAAGMEGMKGDMAGAAAVLGAMKIVAAMKPAVEIRAYIPTVENMINGQALKPGDVIRHVNGKTVEVLNTDAEGRLILADALALACRQGVDEVVDFATLTGACVVALGDEYAGLFSEDEALCESLKEAATMAGERLWRLPLAPEYGELLKSPVADIKNTGSRSGGAITAALFLKHFVSGARWAHIDIAGPAFADKSSHYTTRGGTGFAVRTIANYLLR